MESAPLPRCRLLAALACVLLAAPPAAPQDSSASGVEEGSGAELAAACERGDVPRAYNGTAAWLGACVSQCAQLVAGRGAGRDGGASWAPDTLGGECAACATALGECEETEPAAAAGEEGWLATSLAPEASAFSCSVAFDWYNQSVVVTSQERDVSLRLPRLCFPAAACSDSDVSAIVAEAVRSASLPAGMSGLTGEDTCDLVGSFLNYHFSWVVFIFAIALIAGTWNLHKQKCVPKHCLLLILQVFVSIDVLVGAFFLVVGFLFSAETDFPSYLLWTVLGMGLLQLLIALLLGCSARKDVCRCNRACFGKLAHFLAGLVGGVCGIVGFVFQLAGKNMLDDAQELIGASSLRASLGRRLRRCLLLAQAWRWRRRIARSCTTSCSRRTRAWSAPSSCSSGCTSRRSASRRPCASTATTARTGCAPRASCGIRRDLGR